MAEEKKDLQPDTTSDLKRTKHRSPNYPAIGLQKAVERAKTLYDQAKTHSVPVGAVHEQWGFKAHSGAGNQSVAALKAYGLVEVEGEGEKRLVRVSDVGRRILLGANDRDSLLRQVALGPSLHSELWKKYNGDMPPDSTLRHYLIFDKKFNDDVVGSFIAQFKGTLRYAKLSSDDKVRDEDGNGDDDDNSSNEEQGSMENLDDIGKNAKPKLPAPPTPPAGLKDFPLYLSNSQKAVLYVPPMMSQKDFELLKKQLENSLAVMEAISVISDEQSEQ